MQTKEPNYQDEVKNRLNDSTGVVIAKYTMDGETYLDVRGSEDRIFYHTKAKNWDVVNTEKDRI